MHTGPKHILVDRDKLPVRKKDSQSFGGDQKRGLLCQREPA
jgi:hypothetical protein